MVKIFYGKKGTGKSKIMVETANGLIGASKGDVVFIDDDNDLMYKLKHEIRFVNISEFPVKSIESFLGFTSGLIAENYDIDSIFVDGLTYFVKEPLESLSSFFQILDSVSSKFGIDFYFSINTDSEVLPESLSRYV
ncbi:MAG TPA: hypothetical protein DD727_06710 [Clostridiales bacterium]|nr:hypothetical protein [Clostridiales bacterium]